MQPGIFVMQVADLEVADRFQNFGGDQVELVVDPAHGFEGIEQERCCGTQDV